jgi:hemolysin activation/secretion protein
MAMNERTTMQKFATLLLASALGAAPAFGAEPREEDGVIYFEVSAFEVTGDNPLTAEETDALLEPYLGEQAGFLGLSNAAEVLETEIRSRGYSFHRVIVPPQRARGSIELRVLVFRVGDVTVEGNSHFGEANVLAMLPSLVSGETPNSRALTRDMQRANQHPGKNLTLTLRPSGEEDRVDALIGVEDSSPHRMFVNANNWGSKETGDERVAFGYQYGNLWGRDHVLTATYTTSPREHENVKQYGLTYQIPLYDQASSLTLLGSYSDVDTGVVAEFFEVAGAGTVFGAIFDHSFLSRGRYRHGIRASIVDKQFDNSVDFLGQEIGTDLRSTPVSVTYQGGWVNESASAGFTVGVDRNIPWGRNNDQDAYELSRAGADTDFMTLKLSGFLDYRLGGPWLLRARWAGQYAGDPLIAGEQFGLGGERSVRGFEQRADAADDGMTAAVELWLPRPSERTNILVFLDGGVGKRHDTQVGEEEHPTLLGSGVGLRWRHSATFTTSFDWAYVIEGTSDANDGDNRLHFNVTALF